MPVPSAVTLLVSIRSPIPGFYKYKVAIGTDSMAMRSALLLQIYINSLLIVPAPCSLMLLDGNKPYRKKCMENVSLTTVDIELAQKKTFQINDSQAIGTECNSLTIVHYP